jgi:hypothetical protein
MSRLLAALAVACALVVACGTVQSNVAPAAPKDGERDPTRLVTRSASADVERADPENGPKGAQTLAEKHRGYVESSSNLATTLRLPAPELDTVMAELAALGEVVTKETHSTDVTFQHVDSEARLSNLRRERERYLDLLAKAESVTDAVAVEKELERVTEAIERLEAELKLMDSRVEYATLDVRFSRPVKPGPVGWVFVGVFTAVKWLFVWD